LFFKSRLAGQTTQGQGCGFHAFVMDAFAAVDAQTIALVSDALQGQLNVLQLFGFVFVDGEFHIALVIALSVVILQVVKVRVGHIRAVDFAAALLLDTRKQLLAHFG
jgi:hypothetical protein